MSEDSKPDDTVIPLPYAAYERIIVKVLWELPKPYSFKADRQPGDAITWTIQRSGKDIGGLTLIPETTTDTRASIIINRAQRQAYRSGLPGATLHYHRATTESNHKLMVMVIDWIWRRIEREIWGEGANWKDQKIEFQKLSVAWNEQLKGSEAQPAAPGQSFTFDADCNEVLDHFAGKPAVNPAGERLPRVKEVDYHEGNDVYHVRIVEVSIDYALAGLACIITLETPEGKERMHVAQIALSQERRGECRAELTLLPDQVTPYHDQAKRDMRQGAWPTAQGLAFDMWTRAIKDWPTRKPSDAQNSTPQPAQVGAGDGPDITDVPSNFEEYPYPQLLQSIENDEEKSQAKRINEIGYQGDRSEIARCIMKMGAAGLVDYTKNARTIPIRPKGKQYLEYLRQHGRL